MGIILKLIGVFSELFLICIVLICWKREDGFDFRKDAFSYFGTNKKTKNVFNNGLAICTLLRFLFVSRVINYFGLWENIWVVSIFTAGCLTLFTTSVISWDKNEKIHTAAAKGITITSVLFILIIGLTIWNSNLFLSLVNLLIFLIMATLSVYFLRTKKINSWPQIIFFILIMIWDWTMTLQLLDIIKL